MSAPRGGLVVGLLVLATGAAGFVLGRASAPHGSPFKDGDRRGAERPVEKSLVGAEGTTQDRPDLAGVPSAETSGAGEPAPSGRDLLEDVDGALVQGEIARRAARIRQGALDTAEHAEAIARRQVEEEIKKERAFLEDAARGGTLDMLRRLSESWTPPLELVGTRAKFESLFQRKTSGGKVHGPGWRGEPLADGDVLEFPGGQYPLSYRWLQSLNPFPKDLLVRGLGMDETLLVLDGDLDVRGDVHALTFEDLTMHTNDNYLERLRDAPYTLRLVRCRVVGFDMGAGGSTMLGGHVGAFHAVESRIEAGFGRAPGSGNLFDVRGALLARLDDCTIVGPFRSVHYRSSGAHQRFVGCRFERMHPHIRRHLELPPADSVVFDDCTFAWLPEEGLPSLEQRRSVTEINRTWRDPSR